MGIFSDLGDWYKEQKSFKEAEEQITGKKQSMFNYIKSDFDDQVIKPTKSDWKELKQTQKKDNQELKNEFKKMSKEISPPLGDAIDNLDKLVQTISNGATAKLGIQRGKKVDSKAELKVADHIYVDRQLLGNKYTHHGIYCGDGSVIHYNFVGDAANPNWVVDYIDFEGFSQGKDVYVIDSPLIHTPQTALVRAKSRLGERDYRLHNNNCENFVRWCRGSNEW